MPGEFMKKTAWRSIEPGRRIRFEYGFSCLGTQEPYFALTGDEQHSTRRGWETIACGMMHDELRRYEPGLKDLLFWHLFGVETGPMHYEANALYWWEIAIGAKRPGPYDRLPGETVHAMGMRRFRSTALVYECEVIPSLEQSIGDVRAWLKSRLPMLMANFHGAMIAHDLNDLLVKAGDYTKERRRDAAQR